MKSIKYNAIVNGILSVANIIFPLITFPYISRVLGVEINGKLSFASASLTYFSLFATLGLTTYGVKACARVREDKTKLSKTVHELLIINAITTAIACVALLIAIFSVPRYKQEWILLLIYSWNMILNVVGMNWLYSALEQYDYITKRSIAFKFLGVVLMFVFVHNPDDYYKYAVITVFANVGGNILNIIYSRKYISYKWIGNYDCLHHIKPTLALFATYLAVNVYSSLDSVMLGFISGDFQVGIYTAAVKIRTVLTTLITSIGTVLLPRMSYYIDKGEWDKFRRVLKKSYCTIIMLAVPMMIYFMMTAESSVLFLSGSEYIFAATPMRILMPIMLLSSLSNITGMQILIPTGGEWKFAFSVTCGAIVDAVLNLILIPRMGAIGAAFGTLFAELTQFCVQLYFVRIYIRGVFSRKPTIQVLLGTCAGVAGCAFIMPLLHTGEFLTLIITACIFFGLYAIILGIFQYEIFLELIKMVMSPIRKRYKR